MILLMLDCKYGQLMAKGQYGGWGQRESENIRAVDTITARRLLPVHPHHRRHVGVFVCVSFEER